MLCKLELVHFTILLISLDKIHMQKIHRPKLEDAPEYCHKYFALVKEENLLEALEHSKQSTLDLIKSIPPEKGDYSYESGKWTVKMVLSHIIDCERAYAYRAMRFSRKDSTELTF